MNQVHFEVANFSVQHGDQTKIAAILNVTPDSFSDGDQWFQTNKALEHARELIQAGAELLDIGGESTRPGSTRVPISEEIQRIVPVIKALRQESKIPISVDTWKAEVADAALEAGADIINDITGFWGDPKMAEVVAKHQAAAILMFNPALARPWHKSAESFPKFAFTEPFTPKELAEFKDLEINALCHRYLEKSLERAKAAGLTSEKILLDPGIGFALTRRENLSLIQHLEDLYTLGSCIFLGVSRKRFIVKLIEEAGLETDPASPQGFKNRDLASAQLSTLAASKGIEIIRTHTVEEHIPAIAIGHAVFAADKQANTDFAPYAN